MRRILASTRCAHTIHSACALGDTPFQRRPNRAGEKDLQAIAEQPAPSPTLWHPDAKGGETCLITLSLN